jgi:histone H3/H4
MSKNDGHQESKRIKNDQNDSSKNNSEKIVIEEMLMKNILDSMDIKFQSNVLPQLVELMHRYSEDLLAESYDYASHAGRKTTEIIDLRLALQARSLTNITPTRQNMMDLASEVNSKKIPPILGKVGQRLPPQNISLLSREFRVSPIVKPQKIPIQTDQSQHNIVEKVSDDVATKKRKTAPSIEIKIDSTSNDISN